MNARLGFIGIIGIFFAMGTMPLAELLPFNPYQLLFLRGISGLIIFFLILGRNGIPPPTKETMMLSGAFAIAALALFEAVKAWGANLSAVLLDMSVIIPFLFVALKGNQPVKKDFYCFILAVIGSCIALEIWDAFSNWKSAQFAGLVWSLIALVSNGIFIQYAGASKQSPEVKGFYQSLPLVVIGVLFWGETPRVADQDLLKVILLSITFSITVGYACFAFAFLAFKHLSQVTVGLFVLGVTPSIMLGSYLILDKTISFTQFVGVAIIIAALAYREKTKKN